MYDISDDLTYKSWNNFTLKHFAVRVKMYNEEEFDYKIYNIRLKNDNSNSKTDKRRDNTSEAVLPGSNDKITVVGLSQDRVHNVMLDLLCILRIGYINR